MEFYLSFADLFEKLPNKIGAIFIPVFLVTILVEALFIQARHGSYPWKNTGISALVAVGHLLTQAAAHGIIFGFIVAAVYEVRLTTIPVSWSNWPSLIALPAGRSLLSMSSIAAHTAFGCFGPHT